MASAAAALSNNRFHVPVIVSAQGPAAVSHSHPFLQVGLIFFFFCSSHFTTDCFVNFSSTCFHLFLISSASGSYSGSNIYGCITVLAISSIKTLHAVVLANELVEEVSQSQQWAFVFVSARN